MVIGFVYLDRQRWSFCLLPSQGPADPGPGSAFWQRLRRTYASALRKAESTPLPAWLTRILDWLRARSGPDEPLLLGLRGLSAADPLVVLYARSAGERRARRYLHRYLLRELARHRIDALGSALLLPLTALLTLVPGPNVFFLWNAYRLAVHVLCSSGARRALRALHAATFLPGPEALPFLPPDLPLDPAMARHLAADLFGPARDSPQS